ncbi:ABC transporter ATP-binding protein [Lysobacteraceae bacterium NML75-0749]|nr:ABC transporter ATP-binding protein [Xanthomonadaceae bacterium NML75-0749]PJK04878.1 ABC transporter ATP-binding protein [Xanthomonadaceae bacterium NML91-0268]
MFCDETAIGVKGISKCYEMYGKPSDRLKQMLLPELFGAIGRKGKQYYKEFWALRDISFSVKKGETVGIIGRNGSGKSTLLQMICGTLQPTSGDVMVCGRVAALLELGAGFNPEFTGKENIYLSGLLYGVDESLLKERFDSIVEFSGIGEFIDQPVKTYSSGMYVRLAFAVIAHVDADILVIDEALSVGDVRFGQKCMRFLREFQKRGTLFFVSHDAAAVVNLCSRAVWLEAGEMRMDGDASDVVEAYLAEQHAADREELGVDVGVNFRRKDFNEKGKAGSMNRDFRQDILNGRDPRNVFEVFEFHEDRVRREFGSGAGRIFDVKLYDIAVGSDRKGMIFNGGEEVELRIEADVLGEMKNPIMGFYVKDRLGQRLFGDNTYIPYIDDPVSVSLGDKLCSKFRFVMPVLPNGDYSIDVAFASGTQEDHTQHHWMHDAIIFRATESTMRTGLVGVPMTAIKLEVS